MESQALDVDNILTSLHSALNDTSKSISLHTRTFAELQKICSEQEEKIRNLDGAVKAADQRATLADKRAAQSEEKFLTADGKVVYLEKNVKAWQEAYNAVVQENQDLKNALQQAQYTTASKDAALYYEREARQKLNDVLDRASKTKMDDSQIIALLQQEIINNPSDANYLKLLTEHIEKIKNLKQVNEDTYLAYRLQHGDEKAVDIRKQQEEERKRREQNRKDEDLARKLQNEEIRQAKAKQPVPQAKQQGNRYPTTPPRPSTQPNPTTTTTLVLPPAGSSNSIYYVPPPTTTTVYATNPVNQYSANQYPGNPPPYNGPYTNVAYPPPSYNEPAYQNPPPYQYPSVPQVFPNAYHTNATVGVGNRPL